MALKIGLIGLPNVGKSTLFNALVRSRSAQAQNYAFCTIDPNIGMVEVPDERLHVLEHLVHPAKVIPTSIEFRDIAGLVKGASQGEGLGNQFLHHIREVDAVVHVLRAFEDSDVLHVEDSVDPDRDCTTIETELILADLQTLEKQSDRKDASEKKAVLELLKQTLERGEFASSVQLAEDQVPIAEELHLLTAKPILYAYNVSEDQLREPSSHIRLCAKVEEELIDLPSVEAKAYLHELGMEYSGLDQLIRATYDALDLHTYFTAGPKEVRAWTVHRGASAPEAAGVIHSDFERGFICAEVISYQAYVECGGEAGAKEKGNMRKEGKGYIVQDGDVIHFRFNV